MHQRCSGAATAVTCWRACRAKLGLTPAWSLSARLDNALNRQYQLANGYNTAGRAISVATRYSLR